MDKGRMTPEHVAQPSHAHGPSPSTPDTRTTSVRPLRRAEIHPSQTVGLRDGRQTRRTLARSAYVRLVPQRQKVPDSVRGSRHPHAHLQSEWPDHSVGVREASRISEFVQDHGRAETAPTETP